MKIKKLEEENKEREEENKKLLARIQVLEALSAPRAQPSRWEVWGKTGDGKRKLYKCLGC